MNKLVKKSNRRNLKSTKKSNRKLNKKSNRKNLRNSKLNKKSNRKNLNKKGGRPPIEFVEENHSYNCLCIKKRMKTDTEKTLDRYAEKFLTGGSRKSLRKNKSKKKSNLKKKLNRKGGDLTKNQLQFCDCKSGHRGKTPTIGLDQKDIIVKKCKCNTISSNSEFREHKDKINELFKAYNEITGEEAGAGNNLT